MGAETILNIDSQTRNQIEKEIYIEKIEDVLAGYIQLFLKYPELKKNKELQFYYKQLSLLVRQIRYSRAFSKEDIDNTLTSAKGIKARAEVFHV